MCDNTIQDCVLSHITAKLSERWYIRALHTGTSTERESSWNMQVFAVCFVLHAISSFSDKTALLLLLGMWNAEISYLAQSHSTLAGCGSWELCQDTPLICQHPDAAAVLVVNTCTATERRKFKSACCNSNVNVFSPRFSIINNYRWKNELGMRLLSPLNSVGKFSLHFLLVFCPIFCSPNCCLATQTAVQNMSSWRLCTSIKF